jgi:4-hydroxy-4-methyl-2-oxoglutarate aldolase
MAQSGRQPSVATTSSVRVASCDVSDACDRLGIRAVRSGSLQPLWPDCPSLIGHVTTVRLEPGAGSPLLELLEALATSAAEVVFMDIAGRLDLQCWGTVLATAARQLRVRGALVNGAARDVEGLRALGFPTFARGVYPASMRGRLRFAALNEPVELDGETVQPGACAVADASGVDFVPLANSPEVLKLADELRTREEPQLRRISDGVDARQVFAADDRGAASS